MDFQHWKSSMSKVFRAKLLIRFKGQLKFVSFYGLDVRKSKEFTSQDPKKLFFPHNFPKMKTSDNNTRNCRKNRENCINFHVKTEKKLLWKIEIKEKIHFIVLFWAKWNESEINGRKKEIFRFFRKVQEVNFIKYSFLPFI